LEDNKKSLILNSTLHQGHGFVGNDFQITLTLLDETEKIGISLMKALDKSKKHNQMGRVSASVRSTIFFSVCKII